ncbi:MAG: hypothetical protein ACTHKF_02925 [Candidatus Nitrosocosmicus sp.]
MANNIAYAGYLTIKGICCLQVRSLRRHELRICKRIQIVHGINVDVIGIGINLIII